MHPEITLSTRGRRLWDSLLARDVALAREREPRRAVALEACRAADVLERIETATTAGPWPSGFHPVWPEARRQAEHLAQLIAGLRLPDARTGRRPQRRAGVRGVYRPR